MEKQEGLKAKRRSKKEHAKFIKNLDECALRLQGDRNDEEAFGEIHAALHKFMMGQAFHRFIIRGHEGKDLYQEALIVLWQKAIPSFNPERGMSFWGFAKMCINRHLITILNSALNRKKDMPMNRSVSLDEVFGSADDHDEGCSLQNLFADENDFFMALCFSEDKNKTVESLRQMLSPFESMVLYHYLEGLSYKEIAISVSELAGRLCNEKSVDNALLRIRRKAADLFKEKDLPLFN